MKDKKFKGKKWIIILAVLVLIAIVVTLVIVLLPKNVNDVVKQTEKQSQSMFLKGNDDYKQYVDFQTKISTKSEVNKQDAQNVHDVCLSLNEIISTYSDFMIYAKDNKTFQAEYNPILKNFDKANSQQEKMRKIVAEVNSDLGDKEFTYFNGAWSDFRVCFDVYLDSYTKAINSLNKVFDKCLPTGVLVNDMTKLYLDTTSVYLEVIKSDFSKATHVIKSLDDHLKLGNFDENKVLMNFSFSEKVQGYYKDLLSFQTIYGQDGFKDLIKSLDEEGFHIDKKEQDENDVLKTAELFLTGGLAI